MLRYPKLTPPQWKNLASAFSHMGQAIILFSLAAFFVPQTVSLPEDFSKGFAFFTFLGGLIPLFGSVIISKKEK